MKTQTNSNPYTNEKIEPHIYIWGPVKIEPPTQMNVKCKNSTTLTRRKICVGVGHRFTHVVNMQICRKRRNEKKRKRERKREREKERMGERKREAYKEKCSVPSTNTNAVRQVGSLHMQERLHWIGLAGLINIRFLKYLPTSLDRPQPDIALRQARFPPNHSATHLHPTPSPTSTFLQSSILHLYF